MKPQHAYENFRLALYVTAPDLDNLTRERFDRDMDFFLNHLQLSKAYLENHRGGISLSRERLLELKSWFESRGVATAGGITPTLPASYRAESPRMFGSICYTDPAARERFKQQVEIAASVFDEVIFDDFFFNSCTCDECMRQKGERTWEQFRLELMTEVSRDLIARPGKALNPNVKLVIKYPNWIESYPGAGYNTETQPDIFDGIYSGTETRNPFNSQQHIPRYASYSLMRWMENLSPGRNGGGWFDSLDCTFTEYYLEQAYLTAFGKGKELTLFCYGILKDNHYVPALGLQLIKLDAAMPKLGEPLGIRVYHPPHARGEDHLADYLGMLGLPMEPTPRFPDPNELSGVPVLLTASSAKDPDVMEKLKAYLRAGGTAVLTSGFHERMQGRGLEEVTTLRPTGRKMDIREYGTETLSCTFRDFSDNGVPVSFPVFDYDTNGTWQSIVGFSGENNIPVLMYDNYGQGRAFTLVVPDNLHDLTKLPEGVLNAIRSVLSETGLPARLEGKSGVGLFLYDNGSLVVESFRDAPEAWRVSLPEDQLLEDAEGGSIPPVGQKDGRATFEIRLMPHTYGLYRIVRS